MSLSRSPSAALPIVSDQLTRRTRSQYRRRLRAGSGPHLPFDTAMRHWLDTFHFFHADSPTYAPVTLRMESAPSVTDSATENRNKKSQMAVVARYVYEVAVCRDSRGERWTLICWEIDVPGIQFCGCADRNAAMALFAEPAAVGGRWHGVRMRAERRPW